MLKRDTRDGTVTSLAERSIPVLLLDNVLQDAGPDALSWRIAERQIRHLDALELAGCADCRDVVFTALRLAARDVLEAA